MFLYIKFWKHLKIGSTIESASIATERPSTKGVSSPSTVPPPPTSAPLPTTKPAPKTTKKNLNGAQPAVKQA